MMRKIYVYDYTGILLFSIFEFQMRYNYMGSYFRLSFLKIEVCVTWGRYRYLHVPSMSNKPLPSALRQPD